MTKVLVVDDEFAILEVLSLALSAEGYEVVKASNGREALEKLRAERCDLVLCDLMMPELGGEELRRVMVGDPTLRDIPVILMADFPNTAGSEADVPVLQKPFGLLELLHTVRDALA